MTGLFTTLNSATSGLRAQQTALQTTGHNLANANTVGYSRQRVTMEANVPHTAAGIGQIGTGVNISGITRITDNYVNDQLRQGNSALKRYETTSEMLGQLELIYNEPSETGLASQMSEMFNTWNYLAANPELDTSKTMVVRQSETFASTLNHMANQMDSLAGDAERQIGKQVEDFNSLTSQLVDLNKQIAEATVQGHRPNDLLDKQDRILADLNNIASVTVERDGLNRALVDIGEQPLVTIDKSVNLEINITEARVDVFIDGNDTIIDVERGSIRGLQDAHQVIQDKKTDLDHFAVTFAEQINNIHSDGEGDVFFTFTDPDNPTANNLQVNPSLVEDPPQIQAGFDSAVGDGSRAKAIADLQNKPDEEGSTLFNRYNDMVTDMGIEKQQADNMVANQTDLVALLEQRRESISGVDINEEVVNMIQFQSGFQANARVISTISEMLDTLINRTGV